jgi:anthranilate synthase/aminodeoxychorismate synthase-like glutamine amidotransferase
VILLIDNYDSFTYNVFQLMSRLGASVEVRRNDAVAVEDAEIRGFAGIVISPGPGTPSDAGVSCALIRRLGFRIPILGVCLGHQCIGAAFGGSVIRAPQIMHGKISLVYHRGLGVFTDVPSPFEAVRYHSLVVDPATVPDCLEVTAQTVDGTIMGLRHREHPIQGVQFHPESVLTTWGEAVLRNFLRTSGEILSTGQVGA